MKSTVLNIYTTLCFYSNIENEQEIIPEDNPDWKEEEGKEEQ